MFGFWSSTISGRPYGLGITGGWVNIFQSFTTKIPLNWEGAEVLGIVIGAFIKAEIIPMKQVKELVHSSDFVIFM
jgi:hypothetical protein